RGLSVMTTVLFLYGFFKSFVDKEANVLQLIFIGAVPFFLLFELRSLYVIGFLMSIFAAKGISSLIERNWYSDDLKKLTLLIIFCGIIFTTLSYAGRIDTFEPTENQYYSLSWLETEPCGVVLSRPGFSYYIQYLSSKPVIINDFDTNKVIESDIERIFMSRNLDETVSLLRKYNVRYIYIDSETIDHYWDARDDGLMFLFRNKENFRKIYENEKLVSIWEFIG
ncbi:MAG: hypothetical protein ACOCUR_01580, partial [Nanoarchaeota archaeon]